MGPFLLCHELSASVSIFVSILRDLDGNRPLLEWVRLTVCSRNPSFSRRQNSLRGSRQNWSRPECDRPCMSQFPFRVRSLNLPGSRSWCPRGRPWTLRRGRSSSSARSDGSRRGPLTRSSGPRHLHHCPPISTAPAPHDRSTPRLPPSLHSQWSRNTNKTIRKVSPNRWISHVLNGHGRAPSCISSASLPSPRTPLLRLPVVTWRLHPINVFAAQNASAKMIYSQFNAGLHHPVQRGSWKTVDLPPPVRTEIWDSPETEDTLCGDI